MIGEIDILLLLIYIFGLCGKGKLVLLVVLFWLMWVFGEVFIIVCWICLYCVVGMGGFVIGLGGVVVWFIWMLLVIYE